MYKICICGHFGSDKNFTDGQTIKTKNIYIALKDIYGEEEILTIDTYSWKKKPIKFLIKCCKGIKKSENLIILPAHNGVKVLIPVFTYLNKIYKKNIFYAVVGGWLPELLKKKKRLLNMSKKLTKILVETNKMKEDLNKLGLNNVEILLNFKNITPICESKIKDVNYEQLRVCTFSRVIKSKGIENAINVVNRVNKEYGKTIYKLDIYGQIGDEYKEEFENLMKQQNDSIEYKGIVPFDETVETIKQCDLLLFPTYYDGEGLAGTIIDAFFSGVPVVASDWKYNSEIIENGKTGLIFKTQDDDEFYSILENVHLKKYDITKLKRNCLKEANKYIPNKAIKAITQYIN